MVAAGLVVVAVPVVSGAAPGTCTRQLSLQPQATVSESGGPIVFAVASGGCAAAGHVRVDVVDGSARRPGDFTGTGGELSWTAGDWSDRSVTFGVVDDGLGEAAMETFRVQLVVDGPGVAIAYGVGEGRILDDDSGARVVVAQDVLVVADRGPGGPSAAPSPPVNALRGLGQDNVDPRFRFNVPPQSAVVLRYSTVDGTAVGGVDFVPVTDALVTVPAGALGGELPVTLLAHSGGARSFSVRVESLSPYVVLDGEAVVTIAGP